MSVNQALTPLFNRKRELETLLATLQSKAETADREAQISAGNATALQERVKELTNLIGDMEDLSEKAISTAGGLMNECSDLISKANIIITGVHTFLENLEKQVATLQKEAEVAKAEKAQRLEEISAENTLLDKRKVDLDIYFKRLQKKYHDEGLGDLILMQ